MTPAEVLAVYERAYSLAWHETVRGETVGQAHERAILSGIAAVAASAERAGMLRAAGIAETMADGAYIAKAIRRAAGGAE